MKVLKKLLFMLLIFPLNVLAYSVIPSGENIGINLNMKGILVVGSYKPVNELIKGDLITKIEGNEVTKASDMNKYILENMDYINVTFLRNNKEKNTRLKLYKENGIIKTGLYVRDNISGIGTLTFIDPNDKTFGALGHEIINENDGKVLDIKDGSIFDSNITSITPSSDGSVGEINASINKSKVKGKIDRNTKEGIFGNYLDNIDLSKKMDISSPSLGEAYIITSIDNHIKKYKINIISIDEGRKTKNFVFEVKDQDLISKTNGIVQGMSGSPIIQNDHLVGAVTHVIIDSPHKGYGIDIENMLKEKDK